MSKRRSWLALWFLSGVLVLLVAAAAGCATGDKFPTRPVVISVISVAGSPNDLIAREQGRLADKALGQPFAIENRTGGSGMATMTQIDSQPADGYNLGSVGQGQAAQVIQMDSPVNPDGFEGVINESSQPAVVFTRSDSPWKTIEELVTYAKANPKKLKVGGTGLLYGIGMAKLAQAAGFEHTFVMYAGGPEVVTNLLGGIVDACLMTPPNALQHVKAGTMRPLAVGFSKRIDVLPDVPTFKERGINYEYVRWAGLIVKKGTPKDRIKILHDALKKATEDPAWKTFLDRNGEMDTYLNSDDMTKLWNDEVKAAREFLKASGQQVK